MSALILPLRMILFQSLLLLVAIAIESNILRQQLKLTQKQSVHYATSINFFATAIGWVLFFNLQAILPDNLRIQLMNLIFFDRWQEEVVPLVVLVALVTFFSSFFAKLIGLTELQRFLGTQPQDPTPEPTKIAKFGAPRQIARSYAGFRQGNAILMANAASYSAISLILLIRLVAQNNLNP